MKKFFKQLFLFSIPIVIYITIIITIDPYNVFYTNDNARIKDLKLKTSYKLNYPLFKLQKFKNHPTSTILLGDSRIDKLKENSIEKLAKIKATNMGYGGGTMPEIINTFWHITEYHKLEKVIFGINFNLYNATFDSNRVDEALELKRSPLNYIFSRYNFKSSFYILKSLVTGKDVHIEKPKMNREEFWNFQLEHAAKGHYSRYVYPKDVYKELQKISDYCKEHEIELIIIIPPTHVDLQKRIEDFNLKEEERKFKNDLKKIAKVYDFDYPNEITRDRANFLDPYHFNDSIADVLIKALFVERNKLLN